MTCPGPGAGAAALACLSQFDTIIDARTPAEHAEDRLPGAVNWPSLDNEQRVVVGTMYKQQGAFEAQKHGAAMVAARLGVPVKLASALGGDLTKEYL